jgi:hypothetical protein
MDGRFCKFVKFHTSIKLSWSFYPRANTSCASVLFLTIEKHIHPIWNPSVLIIITTGFARLIQDCYTPGFLKRGGPWRVLQLPLCRIQDGLVPLFISCDGGRKSAVLSAGICMIRLMFVLEMREFVWKVSSFYE